MLNSIESVSDIKGLTEEKVCPFLSKIVLTAVLIVFLQMTFSIQSRSTRHTFERRKKGKKQGRQEGGGREGSREGEREREREKK